MLFLNIIKYLLLFGLLAQVNSKSLDLLDPESEVFDSEMDIGRVAKKFPEIGYQCMLCHWGAKILVNYANSDYTIEKFLSLVSTMCHLFRIESKEVCNGLVEKVGVQLFHILKESQGKVKAADICAMVKEGNCAKYSRRMNDWGLDISDLNRPSPIPEPKYPTTPTKKIQKILHISDPHVQLDYLVGSRTDCGEPICCSPRNGMAKNGAKSASYYGDFNCDLPPWTFDLAMKEIAMNHKDIDFVFLTGDFPAHDIWRQNRTSNLQSGSFVAEVMKKHFPDISVFVAIGNHESYPVNMFPNSNETGKYNPGWLYDSFANFYKHWLPQKEQQSSMREGGYYTILLRPGLRLVSLNTNVCNNLNFFLLLNFNDPSNKLHWLYHILHHAEKNGESVYIIGHIPPGRNSCYNKWSHEYNRLIGRFRNTVLGQFFGHTHRDEFEVFYSSSTKNSGEPSKPINMAYLGPSMTPHQGINPAYRIYEIDGDHENTTNLVLDHSTFYFDLMESIKSGTLIAQKEYSAKKDLQLPNLSAESWEKYVHNIARDKQLFAKFRSIYSHGGPEKNNKCDDNCQRKILCHLLTSESGKDENCRKLYRILEENSNDVSFWDIFWY